MTDKHTFVGKTPDGEYVYSAKKYVQSWDALRKPLEKKLGLKTHSFDPGLRFVDADGRSGTVDIPVWLARRLIEQL